MFIEQDYQSQKFKGLVYQNEIVDDIEFDDCLFEECSFRETTFRRCEFRDCTFKASDLSLIRVENCVFITTTFHDSQLIGINWTEANWTRRGFLKSIDLFGCVINYSTFIGLDLKEVSLNRCVAREADFSEADLSQTDCRNTDFLNSRFSNTNLTKADFRDATNYAIAANLNILKKTRFSLPEAMSLLYGLDIVLDE